MELPVLFFKVSIIISMSTAVSSQKTMLHIGGFIEVNTADKGWNSAGVQPAIDLAIKHINNRTDILPNHTIQIHWKDTKVSLFRLNILKKKQGEKENNWKQSIKQEDMRSSNLFHLIEL